jgi:hypothetical protein
MHEMHTSSQAKNKLFVTNFDDKMSKPHNSGTNGQYNDEYDKIAFEKTRKRHYIPRKINYDLWTSTPNIANIPASCDDEMYDDLIVTTVDLTMVRNAAANALTALVSQTMSIDSSTQVTEDNCLKVSDVYVDSWGVIRCSRFNCKLNLCTSISLLSALLSSMHGERSDRMH